MTYPAQEVLSNIQNNLTWVLLAGGISFIGYYLYYIVGIRMGFRHKTHSIPIIANMYFFAHDVVFA